MVAERQLRVSARPAVFVAMRCTIYLQVPAELMCMHQDWVALCLLYYYTVAPAAAACVVSPCACGLAQDCSGGPVCYVQWWLVVGEAALPGAELSTTLSLFLLTACFPHES